MPTTQMANPIYSNQSCGLRHSCKELLIADDPRATSISQQSHHQLSSHNHPAWWSSHLRTSHWVSGRVKTRPHSNWRSGLKRPLDLRVSVCDSFMYVWVMTSRKIACQFKSAVIVRISVSPLASYLIYILFLECFYFLCSLWNFLPGPYSKEF